MPAARGAARRRGRRAVETALLRNAAAGLGHLCTRTDPRVKVLFDMCAPKAWPAEARLHGAWKPKHAASSHCPMNIAARSRPCFTTGVRPPRRPLLGSSSGVSPG